MIKLRRYTKMTPSTKPMQSMVDAGWLEDVPGGRIEIDYTPMKPIILDDDFVYALPLKNKKENNAEYRRINYDNKYFGKG